MTTARTTPVVLDNTGRRLHAQADALRAAGDAVRVTLPGGLTVWSVTRGEVAKYVVTHPDVRKNPRTSWPGFDVARIPSWLIPWTAANMFNADGDDHQRLRKLVSRAFTTRRVRGLRPGIEAIVADLLEDLEERPAGSVTDLRAAFTVLVPTRVMFTLFGVPDGQRPELQHLVDALLVTALPPGELRDVNARLSEVLLDLVEYKRRHPGDDMTSQLLEFHEEDGDRLTADELLATLMVVIGAGSETTTSLLDHTVVSLLTHPAHLAAVRADPDRWDDAVEETLRLQPPVMHLPLRYPVADLALPDGTTIPAGEPVLVGYGAHGRDPAVHADRDEWNLDREDKAHLAFGHGVHHCLGASLARLEARTALPMLFDRFPRLSLARDPRTLAPQPSFLSNDVVELPVRLRP